MNKEREKNVANNTKMQILTGSFLKKESKTLSSYLKHLPLVPFNTDHLQTIY